MKSFKDYVPEERQEPRVVKRDTPEKPKTKTTKKAESKDKTFVAEVFSAETKKEVYEKEKSILEESLKVSLREEIQAEYDVKFNDARIALHEEMTEKLSSMLVESQEHMASVVTSLMECTLKLSEKIDELQTSLNITVPTPIVQLTLPERTVTKKVHRDSKGNITHISEEIDRED
jgi:hypothetical protein